MTIFEEAEQIVNGAPQDAYGAPERSLERIGMMWTAILGAEVSAHQVALCMAALKIAREAHRPKRDNLVDGCGYLRLAEMCQDADELLYGDFGVSESGIEVPGA